MKTKDEIEIYVQYTASACTHCGVFIDLKKAFDTSDHNILLDKLNFYSFHGLINQWFPHISITEPKLLKLLITYQIKPQSSLEFLKSSVLGPLPFLLYVSGIHQCSTKLTLYLFTDDTNILFAEKN